MSVNNRILLSSPCYGKVDPEILEDWMALAYNCGRRMPEYEFFLGIKTKSEQFRARNAIVEAAQQHNCDRILMLDDDMVIDWQGIGHEAYDFLRQLIGHDKDICGVRYYQRGQDCLPVLMRRLNEKNYRFLRDDEIEYKLQEVDVAGGGCLLIKTRIFDRIPFPYFNPEHQYGTDLQLCRQAQEKGFKIYADTSIELGHLRNEKTLVTSKTRHQFQDSASSPGLKRTFVASELYEALISDVMEYTGIASREGVIHVGSDNEFLNARQHWTESDAEWYRQFPKERICRQVWFNTDTAQKKQINQFILSMIPSNQPRKILDFGCGIGVLAFALAEKGHDVTAIDIRGTGTLEFLKWRCQKNNVPITIIESEGSMPDIKGTFDAIIAMDSLEHIIEWQHALAVLADHLTQGGCLFANNGMMYDRSQPEHYDLHPKAFLRKCIDANLLPQTHISYIKASVDIPVSPEVQSYA